jgi:hypothetical protein
MQFTISPKILVALLSVAATSNAQSTTQAVDPAQASKVASYLSKITTQTSYTSFAAAVSSAVPTHAQGSFLSGDLSKLSTKTWYSAVPSDVRGYAESIQSRVYKYEASDASHSASGAVKSASSAAGASVATISASVSSVLSSASSKAASAASSASSGGASATSKSGAAETGVSKMMGSGLLVAGAVGALML